MENLLNTNKMKRILITLLLGLGAFAYATQPILAEPSHSIVRQQDKKKKDIDKKTETVTFKTTIHCKNCVKKVNDNISFEKGVKDLKISLEDKLVTVTYDPSKTDETTLAKAIEKLGYKAEKTEPEI
jgi:copper chaperone CopZ